MRRLRWVPSVPTIEIALHGALGSWLPGMLARLPAKLKDLQSHFCLELLNPGQLAPSSSKPFNTSLMDFFLLSPTQAILTSPGTNCSAFKSITFGKDCRWSLGKHLGFLPDSVSVKRSFFALLKQAPSRIRVDTNPKVVTKTFLFVSNSSFPTGSWNFI